MSFDIAAHLGAVHREVRNVEYNGQSAKDLIASRVYDTDIADLWEAVTDAERIKRWFSPVSGDLKLGGRYAVEGNASGPSRPARSGGILPEHGSSWGT